MSDTTILLLILGLLIASFPFLLFFSGKKQIQKMESQIPDIKKAIEEGLLKSEATAKAIGDFEEFKQEYRKYMTEFLIFIMIFFAYATTLAFTTITMTLFYVLAALIAILLAIFFLRNKKAIEVCRKFQDMEYLSNKKNK